MLFASCDKIDGGASRTIVREWGMLRSAVVAKMGEAAPTVDEESDLIYHDINGLESVSYRFVSGFLTSTVIVTKGGPDDLEKTASSYFAGYTFLGQCDALTHVYSSDADNAIAVIYPVTRDDESFLVLGWYLKHN